MPKISEVLQRLEPVFFSQKIGDDNHQSALPVATQKLTHNPAEICLAFCFEWHQVVGHRREAVAPTATRNSFFQFFAKGNQLHRIEAHQPDISNRRRQTARIVPFVAQRHALARVEKEPDRHPWLDLKKLQKQLLQPHIGAPVHRPQVVAAREVAMVEKLLTRPRKAARIVAAHNSGKRLLPMNGKPFQPFEKGSFDLEFAADHD